MGRYLTITNSDETKEGIRKKTIGRSIVIGPTAIKFISIAIFAVLALVYLTQSTAGANRSMEIRELDSREAELDLQKERLEVEKNRLKSLGEIDEQFQPAELEPVSSIEHLQTNENIFAKN